MHTVHLQGKSAMCIGQLWCAFPEGELCMALLYITRGVSHPGLAIYIKMYLKAKEEELWKLKYFTMQKII